MDHGDINNSARGRRIFYYPLFLCRSVPALSLQKKNSIKKMGGLSLITLLFLFIILSLPPFPLVFFGSVLVLLLCLFLLSDRDNY